MANEKRLIDANEPLKQLSGYMEKLHCADDYRDGLYRGMEIAESYIKNTPTVDAVEVVHGRWERQKYYGGIRKGMVERIICSECGYPNNKTNYCPNCGAKMDGDEK